MRRSYLAPIACIASGLAVIVGSIILQQTPNPNAVWTPEKVAEYQQVYDELMDLVGRQDIPRDDARRVAVEQRYSELQEELNQARGPAVVVGMVLQMLGVGLGLVGSVWLIVRQNQAADQAGSG